ncbi:F-box protein At5g49610-like [Mangifera indica]|uniref:F-box protein At5g49610-like n=1 Tax=Mangifera indica TaxID=29780 RepID=UPI001CF93E64|nr:F-box protein At5g49610-like [Mangifera indica]XP_044469101.1 F-box protein At5g49610-like [Mangifera indica]XP_044469102.1 F-box protein At5g49610-like [Mangifera indica]
MDQGTKQSTIIRNTNRKIYLELKDIIREHALQYLPAKSILRFTAVCRDWKFLISTPFFAHNQSNHFHNISGFFFQSSSGDPSFLTLNPMAYGVPDPSLKFLPEAVDIRSSSNGLLCCQGRTDYNAYYICNPVSKQWQKLPKPENYHGPEPAVVLIFEPSVLKFRAEYKLVCAFPSELDGYEFEIYSSAEGSWRTSGEIFLGSCKIQPNSGVHANGIIYWTTKNNKILAFDLTMERSQLYYGDGTLGVINGKLCGFSISRNRLSVKVLSNAYTNTMQMHSNIRTWETYFITLDRSALGRAVFGPDSVLCAQDDILVLHSEKTLYLCDMKTRETKILMNESTTVNGKIVPYINSLIDI